MTVKGNAPGPDYDPDSWKLGYQTRQFGVADDPSPSGLSSPMPPGSAYSAMANPPAAMTTAIEAAIPAAPSITPTQ